MPEVMLIKRGWTFLYKSVESLFLVENNNVGIKKRLGRMGCFQNERIVIESFGRYGHGVVEAVMGKEFPVIIGNLLLIHRFTGSME